MKAILRLLLSAVAVVILSKVLPGASVDSYPTAILVALVLSLLNFFRQVFLFHGCGQSLWRVIWFLYLEILNCCVSRSSFILLLAISASPLSRLSLSMIPFMNGT